MSSSASALRDWLGFTGAVCFALMLLPQALLNAHRKSTEGLSLGLIVTWHAAAVLYLGYELAAQMADDGSAGESGAPWLVASMVAFVVMSSVIEAQIVAPQAGATLEGLFVCLPVCAALTGVSVAISFACMAVFMSHENVAIALGASAPAALFALGFIPQFWVFYAVWSVEGYSLGVSLLDMGGAAANTALIFVDADAAGAEEGNPWVTALPFLSIFGLQVVLLLFAAVIAASAPRTLTPPSVRQRKSTQYYDALNDEGAPAEGGGGFHDAVYEKGAAKA